MRICCFGSMNLDYVYQVPHFVRPGETLSASRRSVSCGGKGLNQSIAMARSGATVFHAGNVGATDGQILVSALSCDGVDTTLIQLQNYASGHAVIQVNAQGENCILLYGGANITVTPEQVDEVLDRFSAGDWLVLQNEINLLPQIVAKARQKGLTIALNASPVEGLNKDFPLHEIDYLFVNEEEACSLAQALPYDRALDVLAQGYPSMTVVCTLGREGATVRRGNRSVHQKAIPAKAVDTTGAGDTFLGYFIGSLVQGCAQDEALSRALFAAHLCVQREGAAGSIPYANEVAQTMQAHMAGVEA